MNRLFAYAGVILLLFYGLERALLHGSIWHHRVMRIIGVTMVIGAFAIIRELIALRDSQEQERFQQRMIQHQMSVISRIKGWIS